MSQKFTYKIFVKKNEDENNKVVILKISKKDPKNYMEVKTTSNRKFVYLNKINQFHENFGKFFEKLEDAEQALQEIFKSKPFTF